MCVCVCVCVKDILKNYIGFISLFNHISTFVGCL